MKNEKLIRAIFASGSSNRTEAIIALAGGLAAGAIIGVLFAPSSGKAARSTIVDRFKSLIGIEEEQEQEVATAPQRRVMAKKPKSDIKSLIHDAHDSGIHTENAL
jgi:gas vesicle protein